MKHYKEAVIAISKIEDPNQLVQLFELILSSVTIGTTQQIADLEGKSYNGIKNSNNYAKVMIGGKRLVACGARNLRLPF